MRTSQAKPENLRHLNRDLNVAAPKQSVSNIFHLYSLAIRLYNFLCVLLALFGSLNYAKVQCEVRNPTNGSAKLGEKM